VRTGDPIGESSSDEDIPLSSYALLKSSRGKHVSDLLKYVFVIKPIVFVDTSVKALPVKKTGVAVKKTAAAVSKPASKKRKLLARAKSQKGMLFGFANKCIIKPFVVFCSV
jgi:hypothetical protein